MNIVYKNLEFFINESSDKCYTAYRMNGQFYMCTDRLTLNDFVKKVQQKIDKELNKKSV